MATLKNKKNIKNTPQKNRRKKALGKGLDALIPDMSSFDAPTKEVVSKDYFQCDIELIQPNPLQPRFRFSEEELTGLADSIKSQGILQPLLVRTSDFGYELVAGERRLRAAKLADLETVPVMVKKISDAQLLEVSIVENIQRENLNPIEEAEGYHRLMTEFDLTQEQAAERVGKSRSAVANFLRLRQLPDPIKNSILDGKLSMGHARAILGITNSALQNKVFKEIIARQLSVRQTESLVKRLKEESENTKEIEAPSSLDNQLKLLCEGLSRHFGTKVQIKRNGKRGRVEIEFYSDDDLERLLELLQSPY
jgi:ParB family transcriptional regulator, chromosome partitioning protein